MHSSFFATFPFLSLTLEYDSLVEGDTRGNSYSWDIWLHLFGLVFFIYQLNIDKNKKKL